MKYSRLSVRKVNKIIMCISEDMTATTATRVAGVNRNTANAYYRAVREGILRLAVAEPGRETGEFEMDESCFGAKRVRGKRGRGAAGKTPVFGLLKRGGKVFVTVVANCPKAELVPVIQGKILQGAVVHTDGWKAYDGLVLNGYDPYRVFHSSDEFARGKSHVNGIGCFWSFAKRRLAKFNGCSSGAFVLHLKECEFRFNHRGENLVPLIKKLLLNRARC
jgi:transposase-like protein